MKVGGAGLPKRDRNKCKPAYKPETRLSFEIKMMKEKLGCSFRVYSDDNDCMMQVNLALSFEHKYAIMTAILATRLARLT